MTQNRQIVFEDLGQMRFADAWALQRAQLDKIVARKIANKDLTQPLSTENQLYFVEHPPVYTLGKSGDAAHVLLSPEALERQGVEYYPIDRGGDVTFHGPGQLVAYPVLDLDNFFTDLARYLRTLEEAIIRTIAHYGLQGGRISGLTGVWVGVDSPNPRKIAALGIKCSRWVTMHGLALNVNTDLSYFSQIIPCGIVDKGVTSIAAELRHTVELNEVKGLLKAALAACLGAKLVE